MRPIPILLLIVVLGPASLAPAQTRTEGTRLPALHQLANDLANGDLERATAGLRSYLVQHPCDAMMLYNLACVRSLAGDVDGALLALDQAFAAGYHDLGRALTDVDLARLHGTAELQRLVSGYQARRVDQQERARFAADHGSWSAWSALDPESPCDGEAPAGRFRVRVRPAGLEFEIDGPFESDDVLQLVVGRRAGPESLFADQTYVFEGTTLSGLTLVQWNRSLDRRDDRVLHVEPSDRGVRALCPWNYLPTLGPPLEHELGLNVRVVGQGTVALVPDPYIGSTVVRERRVAMFTIEGVSPQPLVNGALTTNFVVGDSVYFDLGIEGAGPGQALLRATIESYDSSAALDTNFTVALEPDVTFLSVALDVQALGSRASSVRVALTADDIDTLRWSSDFVALPTDWFARSRARVDSLRVPERSIVEYPLFQVMSQTRTADPHDDPRPAAVAVARVGELLERARDTGSVLVSATDRFEPVAFRDGATDLYPSWYRPGRSDKTDEAIVLVCTPAEAEAQRAEVLRRDPAATVLQLGLVPSPGDPAATDSTVARAIRWMGRLVERPVSTVIATAPVASPVSRAALAEEVATIRLVAVGAYDPWPRTDVGDIATWDGNSELDLVFLDEPAPRARAIVEALRSAGYVVNARVDADGHVASAWLDAER